MIALFVLFCCFLLFCFCFCVFFLLILKVCPDGIHMIERLSAELSRVGLEINGKKTKVLTTDSRYAGVGPATLLDSNLGFLQVMRQGDVHKYSGKMLTGNLVHRGEVNLSHRLPVGWTKFHGMAEIVTKRFL